MKSLLFCALGLGVVALSSSTFAADKPHHGGGHPASHSTIHRTTTVHRSPGVTDAMVPATTRQDEGGLKCVQDEQLCPLLSLS